MIYTKEWAFIHIPKVSGINFMKRMLEQPEVINGHKGIIHINHQPLQWWLDNKTLNKKQYIFCFVRNPYARTVSLYNHMLTSGNNPGLPEFKKYIMTDVIDRKTPFGLNFGFHWPQYKYIENDQGIDVKYYKMETELPLVEDYIGHIFTDTRYNEKQHAPWQTYYDSETIEKINEKYKEDFTRFNYEYI